MDEKISRERRELRREILARRDGLPAGQRGEWSAMIHDHLWSVEAFGAAATVFSYAHFRGEVETLALLARCLAQGKRVAVPLTVPGQSLEPCLIKDFAVDLRPGYRGIPEPDPSRCPILAPGLIDVVLLPGSVFDRQGGRLGYGGGYYDRFLAEKAPRAIRIGLAFELQVVAAVPLLAHDQRLDFLVTERGVTACGRGGRS